MNNIKPSRLVIKIIPVLYNILIVRKQRLASFFCSLACPNIVGCMKSFYNTSFEFCHCQIMHKLHSDI